MSNLVDVHMKAPRELLEKLDRKVKEKLTTRTKITIYLWSEWLKEKNPAEKEV